MSASEKLTYTKKVWLVPLIFVLLIWSIYWIEIHYGYNFNKFGLYPRKMKGLIGVFTAHFIHSDVRHLFNNTIPLLVLTATLIYFYRSVAFKVMFFGAILSQLITWLIAREAYHIGASGIIYLLFSFTVFSGIIRKHYRLLSISFVVIFLYGSLVWYLLPVKEQVSWEGHLGGFFMGLIFAFIYRKKGIVKNEFQFTKTHFDDMFDDEGNLKIDENSETE